ncbi:hypothetical protein L596_022296 [Steinernema carpocapsae]|uniref:Serpin domain-containing protein n=1 Tax=Steinernema carpocapsae TaxID=34508 RepID=A0A4U5MLB5_STECR|nr:hypothetical protein L596_022296 [Steinernema carpocapsae]
MAFDHQLNDALFRLSMNALKEKNSASAVVSPFSIAMALAAVNVGAKDKTSQEITEVAFDGIPKEKVTAWFRQKLDEMKKYSSPLAVASAVYLDKTLKMLENYKNDVAKNFDTVSQSADFRGNPRAERQTLNNYVEKNTGGHIKDLFGEDDITSDTRLVTVNAVYMKAAFHVRFQKEDTKEVTFHNEDGSIKQLQTMHDTKKGSFFETDDFIYGHFAFVDYGFAFFVAVPKKSHLANLKESFTTSNQSFSSAHTGAEHVPYMHIALPKFNSEGSYKLKETLSQLGISQLFNPHGANLSGITNEQVHVEKVIHKAILELDEDGVTAAAVTAMGIEPMCLDMSREERNLKADRPFLYGVTYNGTPLFVGQYY